MLLIFYCALLMVASAARGNENGLYREDERDDDGREPKIEESFDSPVYSPSNFFRPGIVNGKAAYNVPPPVLPSTYSAYPSSLGGYGLPYGYGPYNRFGAVPYSVPSSYGALLSNPAFASALMSGLGYAGYGGPYFGRTAYPSFGYGFSNYMSGLSYPPVGIRRGPTPIASAPAPVISAPVLPAPVMSRSAALTAAAPTAPVFDFMNTIPGVAASYRFPQRVVQGKDGTIRPADPQILY